LKKYGSGKTVLKALFLPGANYIFTANFTANLTYFLNNATVNNTAISFLGFRIFTRTFGQPGLGGISLTITGSMNGTQICTQTFNASFTVLDVAPVIYVNTNEIVSVGMPWNLTGSVYDPGFYETFNFSVLILPNFTDVNCQIISPVLYEPNQPIPYPPPTTYFFSCGPILFDYPGVYAVTVTVTEQLYDQLSASATDLVVALGNLGSYYSYYVYSYAANTNTTAATPPASSITTGTAGTNTTANSSNGNTGLMMEEARPRNRA